MSTYKATLISPEGKFFDDLIESLTARGDDGLFGVLARHAPMVKILDKGIIRLKGVGFEENFKVDSGVLEVDQKGTVLILADNAQPINKSQTSPEGGNT